MGKAVTVFEELNDQIDTLSETVMISLMEGTADLLLSLLESFHENNNDNYDSINGFVREEVPGS